MSSSPLALAALVGANLLPLVGVLFFDWSLFAVILLYWAESGIIGVFNIVKMLLAGLAGRLGNFRVRAFLVPFFALHYGIFWIVHGVLVVVLFGSSGSGLGVAAAVPGQATSGDLWIVLLSLALSHGMSFGFNFVGNGEYRHASPAMLMFQPYGRVVVLHVTIIGGGIAAQALGEPLWALVLMVALKIVVDLWAHLREHRTMAAGGVDEAARRARMREAFEALRAKRDKRGD